MKEVFTILALICFMLIQAQTPEEDKTLERDKIYVFKSGTPVHVYNRLKSIKESEKIIAQSGWKFQIDEVLEDGFIIRFTKWKANFLASKTKKESAKNKNLTFVNQFESEVKLTKDNKEEKISYETPLYYFIDKSSFENRTATQQAKTPIYSFVSGAVTVPIKIRPGGDERNEDTDERIRQFDFANDINVGISAGFKIRIDSKQRAFFNILGGISLTSVSVDEGNTNNFVEQKTNASAITYSIGLVFQYDDFQFGFFNGWDYLSRDFGENWVYQGRPWYGIGLGLSIFSTKNKSTTNE